MNRQSFKPHLRKRRHMRVRKKVFGSPERPRLAVFRSLRNVYAQIIDDTRGTTLTCADSLEMVRAGTLTVVQAGNKEGAEAVGTQLAERAKEAGIVKVKFDRGGYRFHGRIQALADGARKNGLEF